MSAVLDSIVTAFASVIDPEIHRPITEPNMVSPEDVTIDGSSVSVKILLTTAGCPLHNAIAADVKSALGVLEGVKNVTVEMGVMNDEQKEALREELNDGRPGKEIPLAQPDSLTRVIAMTSGKGGVGESSMAVNLVAVMAKSGLRVGVMDADTYGFSVPRMLGVAHEPQVIDGMILPPLGAQGVKVVSIGMFVPDSQPVVWHGPTLHRALQQFLADVFWGGLDVPLTDMPPGTRDVAISIAQLLLNSQILVVTTPQIAAAEVAEGVDSIASQTQQRIIGVVENMSYLPQPSGSQLELLGSGGGVSVSAHLSAQLDYETPLPTQVSLDITLREDGNVGHPITLDDGPASQALSKLAEKLSVAGWSLSGRPLGVFPIQKWACRLLVSSRGDDRLKPEPRHVFRRLNNG